MLWSDDEMKAIQEIMDRHNLSEAGALRQALRLYQVWDRRIANGETVTWSGDAQRMKEFSGSVPPPFPGAQF